MTKWLLFLLPFVLVSCVSGPSDPNRTLSDKLNGENYESGSMVMGVPVLVSKLVQRKFSGRIFCGEGLAQVPAKNVLVELVAQRQVVGSATTGMDGSYGFSASVNKEVSYSLNAKGSCGSSSRVLANDAKDFADENLYLK